MRCGDRFQRIIRCAPGPGPAAQAAAAPHAAARCERTGLSHAAVAAQVKPTALDAEQAEQRCGHRGRDREGKAAVADRAPRHLRLPLFERAGLCQGRQRIGTVRL